ncbi:cupin-like domain-containing protein [Paraflavitalea soli]|uniref:Cupin-like domain-containing protein n=1 Tax=Paraflavitalea soli TaxID=2315862 RepID=A0A3B7MJA3_9BACT|nr:cupin-like domain-containing protein [Paraflavitalea soli]AXY73687.1 cupin-like domain-containing protein [Paraflavitalea soli]
MEYKEMVYSPAPVVTPQGEATQDMVRTISGNISHELFLNEFVKKGKPVLLKGAVADWHASKHWDMEYFKHLPTDPLLSVKKATIVEGETEKIHLSDYVRLLETCSQPGAATTKPPYLHDVAMFGIIPELTNDVSSPIIKNYLPAFYHEHWWKYVQFFMSIKGHITPLHFDTLITHNLFFQVKGKKRFTLIDASQRNDCYMKKWRWAQVDPKAPALDKYPAYAKVTPMVVEVEGGDILYMPAGMLHHVESLGFSISFNIDWHSRRSVLKGMLSRLKGSPTENLRYNFLLFLAIWCKVPEKYIWPYYKSYLNYIS